MVILMRNSIVKAFALVLSLIPTLAFAQDAPPDAGRAQAQAAMKATQAALLEQLGGRIDWQAAEIIQHARADAAEARVAVLQKQIDAAKIPETPK